MRLPEPVYESLPYLYAVSGALILGGSIYSGIGNAATHFFLIGILSILGGVVVYLRRRTARQK
jgi:hypothetical protein